MSIFKRVLFALISAPTLYIGNVSNSPQKGGGGSSDPPTPPTPPYPPYPPYPPPLPTALLYVLVFFISPQSLSDWEPIRRTRRGGPGTVRAVRDENVHVGWRPLQGFYHNYASGTAQK